MPDNNWQPDDWLTRKEASSYLGKIGCPVAHRTLANMAANNNAKKGPPFTQSAWTVVHYQRKDLDSWAAARIVRVA